MLKDGRFHHGFPVEIAILRQEAAVRVPSQDVKDLFIRDTAGHKIGLGLDGDPSLCQTVDYTMAGKVLVEDEDQAARCSISQRRASSTTGISRS